jgi:hypothetical protein
MIRTVRATPFSGLWFAIEEFPHVTARPGRAKTLEVPGDQSLKKQKQAGLAVSGPELVAV